MFDDVEFDDALRQQADKELRNKSKDLKYYLMAFAFVGISAFVILKFSK